MRWVGSAMPDLVAEMILEGWKVPRDAWEGLLEGDGADQVFEVYDALRTLMPPLGMANRWMGKPNDNALFGGQPPMKKLLEPGGLVAIRHLVRGQLNVW